MKKVDCDKKVLIFIIKSADLAMKSVQFSKVMTSIQEILKGKINFISEIKYTRYTV